jgi:Golgi phosphoprotein 3 GPP34
VLIAEDLLLLVTDDVGGGLYVMADHVDLALRGALLVELTLMDRVGITHEGDQGRPGRVVVRNPSATGDPVLDAALRTLGARRGRKPTAAVRVLNRDLRRTLYERLAANGMLRAERGRILGIIPTLAWPAQDAQHEAEVRRLVTEALLQPAAPDARTAALVALLHALSCEHRIVDPAQHGLSKVQLRKRAEEIGSGDWASQAVRRAIAEWMGFVPVVAAIAAAAAAASAGAAGTN